MYERLSKLYYKDSTKYAAEYEKRLNSYGTSKLPFHIKPYKSTQEFPCFYVNHPELDLLHDQIVKQSRMIESIVAQLPPIAVRQYIRAKLIEELLSTNEIEGVQSTKAEMETAMEMTERKGASQKNKVRHQSLMRSYVNLLSETKTELENIEHVRTIYDQLVHDEIKEEYKLDGGLFRKEPVDVVTETGKTLHRNMFSEQMIQTQVANLIRYLNEYPAPMLYKIAISHYYFGYIHPFYDGNGRTSRYISSMYLLHDLDRLTALTLSYSTNKLKQSYYNAFIECNNPHNKGELTFFCEVFFDIIDKAQIDILADLSEKRQKMENLVSLVERVGIKNELTKNLFFLIGQSYIFGIQGRGLTFKDLVALTEKTEYTVRKSLDELEQLELLEVIKKKPLEVTIHRNLLSYFS